MTMKQPVRPTPALRGRARRSGPPKEAPGRERGAARVPAVHDHGARVRRVTGLHSPQESQEWRRVLGHPVVRPRRELELADLTLLTGAVLGTTGTLPVTAALRAWTEDAKLTPRGPPASHTPTGCVTVANIMPDFLPRSAPISAGGSSILPGARQDSGVPLDPLPLPHPTGSALISPKPARFSPPPWRWPSWSSPLRPGPPVQTLAPTVRPPHSGHQRATVSTGVRSAPPPPTGLPSTLAQVLTEALASSLSPHHSLCYNHNISLIVSPSCPAWSCPRTFARAEPLPGMLFSQIS